MRNTGLDLLRLVAILLVLGRHLLPGYENNTFLSIWRTGGWVGVDLFFVLSGFLVSGLLFEEYKKRGSLDLKRFLIRRGFKIYPPVVPADCRDRCFDLARRPTAQGTTDNQ